TARLQPLLEVPNELAKAADLEVMCRTAVEQAIAHLGFERMGIWFRDEEEGYLRGSFGVGEDGRVRDERSRKIPIMPDDEDARRVLNREVRFVLRGDTDLRDGQGNIVGHGTRVMAPLWDGQTVIGFVYIDNHLTHNEITEDQGRILALFAVSLGHLCSLHRTAEALRRGEEERHKLEEQMQHTQKLESLGVLAGGIAHDFNNLLVSVMGNADLAQIEVGASSRAHDLLAKISKAAARAADLCRRVLAYSGKGEFVIETLSMNEIVLDMAGLVGMSVSRNTKLNYCLADHLPLVEGDATQLRQVVMNLVTNANEALDEKPGVVTIATGVTHCVGDEIDLFAMSGQIPPGDYVFLEVSDTGCGIEGETVERIFDPFFSTKFAGRGLGLAAVLGIVRGHGGAIKVNSTPGAGTIFCILLPAKSVYSPTPPDEDREAFKNGSGTVLIIDDEEQVRELGAEILVMAGYEVIGAPDGASGVALLEEHAGKVLVVLLDMAMPGMDGFETFQKLREVDGEVPIVLCSGYGRDISMERFQERDLAGFLAKPFRMNELLKVVSMAVTAV
ncbi:MAG: response regulator, partial [Candidatus Hydrogenedentes bacterium]|nr:response regulator [Candidatus Hydrogenedentota bacterium]